MKTRKPKIVRYRLRKGEVLDVDALLEKHGFPRGAIRTSAIGTHDQTLRFVHATDRELAKLEAAGERFDAAVIDATCDDCAKVIEADDDIHFSEIHIEKGIRQWCTACFDKRGRSTRL